METTASSDSANITHPASGAYSLNRSLYENRARLIHGGNGARAHAQPPVDITADEYWKTKVRTPEDVVTFYSLYYPALPRELVLAMADYFTKIAAGEIPLPEYLDARKQESQKWDYKKELEEQKMLGKIAQSTKRLEQLLQEEDNKPRDEDGSSEKKQKAKKRK